VKVVQYSLRSLGYLGSYDVRHKPNINQSTENIQGALNDWRVASLVYSTRSETKKNNEKKLKQKTSCCIFSWDLRYPLQPQSFTALGQYQLYSLPSLMTRKRVWTTCPVELALSQTLDTVIMSLMQ